MGCARVITCVHAILFSIHDSTGEDGCNSIAENDKSGILNYIDIYQT